MHWSVVFAHVSTACLLWSHIRQGAGIDLSYLRFSDCLSRGRCPLALHTGCWLVLSALGWEVSLSKQKLPGGSCAVLEPLWSLNRALVPTWLVCSPCYLLFTFYQLLPRTSLRSTLLSLRTFLMREKEFFGQILSVHEFYSTRSL